MFVIQAIVRIIIGPDDRQFFDGQKFIMKAKQFKEITGLNEGLAIKSTQVMTILVTIILVSLLFWFLQRTRTGKSMRAFSDNEDLALLSGINPDKVVFITWLIVGALATVAGTLYGLDKSFKPFTYLGLVLPIFASAIVGGIGSPVGAVVGGYVIAFSEIMVTYAYKKFFIYLLPKSLEPSGLVQLLSTDYKFAVSFSILVIVLLILVVVNCQIFQHYAIFQFDLVSFLLKSHRDSFYIDFEFVLLLILLDFLNLSLQDF